MIEIHASKTVFFMPTQTSAEYADPLLENIEHIASNLLLRMPLTVQLTINPQAVCEIQFTVNKQLSFADANESVGALKQLIEAAEDRLYLRFHESEAMN